MLHDMSGRADHAVRMSHPTPTAFMVSRIRIAAVILPRSVDNGPLSETGWESVFVMYTSGVNAVFGKINEPG